MDSLARAKELFLAALAHQERGELAAAEQTYRKALELAPTRPSITNNLAVILLRSQRFSEAQSLFKGLLSTSPGDATAILNLGNCQLGLKATAEALASFEMALAIKPGYVEALVGRATALMDLGRPEEALASCNIALAGKPDCIEALLSRGVCLRRLERADEALSSYDKVLTLDPRCADALAGRGNVLLDLNRFEEALASCEAALAIQPDHVEALINRSSALLSLRRPEEALASCERALAIKPDLAEGHYNLGTTLVRLDRQQEALRAFARAIAQRPDFAAARWVFTMAQLPAVYEAETDPERCRTAFSLELANLSHWFGSNPDHDPDAMALQPFYLAYQEHDNRDLLARYGKLSAEIMRRWSERQRLPRDPPPKRSHFRVGIVSAHIFEHSVWTALIKGWVQHLDRGRFDVDVFHVGQTQDQETLFARSHASHFQQGPKGLREWVHIILERQPDVLIYPELGMDGLSGKLASSRLAPVQVASWGHPETSGLPTIDYYLSAKAFEPPGAQQYYTERLVTLPGSGCCYKESSVTAVEPDLARLGIDSESPILICPGTPYKYAPQYDRVFPAIARRIGRCQFVFFMHQPAHLSEKLHRRLKAAFERDGLVFERYVVVIPWQPRAAFHGLMRRAGLYLDTIGFSGFNTAMQAVGSGLPIVTREGRFMRGRLASGLLKQMGLSELVAQSEEEYVATAARLVREVEYGRLIRARIEGARASLREDIAPIRTLEDFLLNQVPHSAPAFSSRPSA
jgi:predicted O-linked N-acetylglucosamine transferase (SPINDLY family)